MARVAPIASAVRSCCSYPSPPMPTATTSTGSPSCSLMRTASSSAIASNGLITNGMCSTCTRLPSPLATIFWSVSGTRFVGTRIFIGDECARRRPGVGPLHFAVVIAGHVDALGLDVGPLEVARHVEVAVGLDRRTRRTCFCRRG